MPRPPDDPTPRRGVPELYESFEEESTVSIKPAFQEDDPTEPFSVAESAIDDTGAFVSGVSGGEPAPANLSMQRVMAEVERLRTLAGSRGSRLTEEIVAAIRLGVALGGPARLTPDMAVAAASGLLALTDDQYTRAAQLLRRAGQAEDGSPAAGADVDAERSLILRAVAERRSKLETGVVSALVRRMGFTVSSDRNLEEITAFAEEIRGRNRR